MKNILKLKNQKWDTYSMKNKVAIVAANYYEDITNDLVDGVKNNLNESNASGGSYIYLAFAESPFKYARAR